MNQERAEILWADGPALAVPRVEHPERLLKQKYEMEQWRDRAEVQSYRAVIDTLPCSKLVEDLEDEGASASRPHAVFPRHVTHAGSAGEHAN